jgi:nicotinamidase-related amidase
MSEPIWNKFLTDRDKAVFGASGYGARGGFGKRPALLIIDVNYAFCDERPMPILESIKRWRNSCGEDAWVAMPYLKSLIDKAHAKGIPVMAAGAGRTAAPTRTSPASRRPTSTATRSWPRSHRRRRTSSC